MLVRNGKKILPGINDLALSLMLIFASGWSGATVGQGRRAVAAAGFDFKGRF